MRRGLFVSTARVRCKLGGMATLVLASVLGFADMPHRAPFCAPQDQRIVSLRFAAFSQGY
ncbi:MAG: hypothetical protein CML03_03075 [Pseudooceanicola sp.]|nr:hypothetical protein [Pseudooceanicola sp.]